MIFKKSCKFKKSYKKLSKYGKKIVNKLDGTHYKLDGTNCTGGADELANKYSKLEESEQAFIDKMYSCLEKEIDYIDAMLEGWKLGIEGNNLKKSLIFQGYLKEQGCISKLRYTIDDTLKETYQEVVGYRNYLELSRADYNLMKSFLPSADDEL